MVAPDQRVRVVPIDDSNRNTTPDIRLGWHSLEHDEDGSVSTENEHPMDAWVREANERRQSTYGDRFGPCPLTMAAWTALCIRAQQAGAALPPDAAYDESRHAAKGIFTPFFESQILFLEDTLSVWERIKYYIKGLKAGLIGEDQYKTTYHKMRGNIGEVNSKLASLRQRPRYVAEPQQMSLHNHDVADLLLYLFKTIMHSEDLLRMSGAPMATFRKNISGKLSKVAMVWQDTWPRGNYGRAVNTEKLAAIAAIVEQARSLADTAEKGIDANDASKFRVFLVLLNLITFLGTWFYVYVVPEENLLSVQACAGTCDMLLEQSRQHWSLAANTTLG